MPAAPPLPCPLIVSISTAAVGSLGSVATRVQHACVIRKCAALAVPVQEVNEKRRKAIKKAVDKEEKQRAPTVQKAAENPEYLAELRARVQQLQADAEALNAALPGS